jgi:hypothetical protein
MLQYLNLPQIPKSIIESLPANRSQYDKKFVYGRGSYVWSDSFNQDMNDWCQQNISKDVFFGFQIMTSNVPIHRDKGPSVKLVYLIDPGGESVSTKFYNDEYKLTKEYVIETNRWHLLQVNQLHSVNGIEPEKSRFSIAGTIFT